nr:MAG TPA: hypothetical protein [Caudoviricetes sp.]
MGCFAAAPRARTASLAILARGYPRRNERGSDERLQHIYRCSVFQQWSIG